jgi:hypothetical protein
MRLSIVVSILNSYEVVRRQLLHYSRMDFPDDVEILWMDDGSDPPLVDTVGVPGLRIIPTGDIREWTWAIARNSGARLARGGYLLMTDIDYILSRDAIMDAREFDGDRMGFKREFGVLDENGFFTQNMDVLLSYGLDPARIPTRGVKVAPHPNNFVMRKDLFWQMGGYREDRIGWPYPQGEDRHFKKVWLEWVKKGRAKGHDYRPTIYMFPNGQFCAGNDVDSDPCGLFHKLSRKTSNG